MSLIHLEKLLERDVWLWTVYKRLPEFKEVNFPSSKLELFETFSTEEFSVENAVSLKHFVRAC